VVGGQSYRNEKSASIILSASIRVEVSSRETTHRRKKRGGVKINGFFRAKNVGEETSRRMSRAFSEREPNVTALDVGGGGGKRFGTRSHNEKKKGVSGAG